MRVSRFLLVLFLVRTHEVCAAEEEETLLPTNEVGTEDAASVKLAEEQRAAADSVTAEEAAAAAATTIEENAYDGEEGSSQSKGGVEDGEELNGTVDTDKPDAGASLEEDMEHEQEEGQVAGSQTGEDAADALEVEQAARAPDEEGEEGKEDEPSSTAVEEEEESGEEAFAAATPTLEQGKAVGEGTLEDLPRDADSAGKGFNGFIDGWRGEGGRRNPLKAALGSYDALLEEHYLKMSFAQATVLGVAGDAIAQRLERRWNPGQKYELKRTVHAGVLNMIVDGIFTPQWYNLVDYVNDEMTLALAFVKSIAASVFYGPFANGLFLAGARMLRYGLKARFDWAEWRRQLTVCTIRDFEMWPPLHILNFWLVPKHWRPVAGHLVGVALLAVISSTDLNDVGLPLGKRAVPLMMSWARAAGERLGVKGRRASGAPPPGNKPS